MNTQEQGSGAAVDAPQADLETGSAKASTTVFSLRLPVEELSALRDVSERTALPVSELVRAAIRAYLSPSGTVVAISASAQPGMTISTFVPLWSGGRASGEQLARTEIVS